MLSAINLGVHGGVAAAADDVLLGGAGTERQRADDPGEAIREPRRWPNAVRAAPKRKRRGETR